MHEWLIEALVLRELGFSEKQIGWGKSYYKRQALFFLRTVRKERPELQTVDELVQEIKARGWRVTPLRTQMKDSDEQDVNSMTLDEATCEFFMLGLSLPYFTHKGVEHPTHTRRHDLFERILELDPELRARHDEVVEEATRRGKKDETLLEWLVAVGEAPDDDVPAAEELLEFDEEYDA